MKLKRFNEQAEERQTLPMRIITTYEVDYDDLDSFVKKVYGFKYDSVVENEWNNDSSYTFQIKGDLDLLDEGEEEQIRDGENPYCCVRSILEILCADGHIPSGHYTIKVCW